MASDESSVWPSRASSRELLRLAWPLILAQSFWTLQIVLDRVLLSRSGTAEVGAGLSAAVLFWSALALFQFTVGYATTFVAQYTGAGQPLRVGAVIGQALWVALFAGVGFVAVAPFAGWLAQASGHDPEVARLEAVYLRCLCLAAPPYLLLSAASSFFAGRGDSRTVLLLNGVGLAVHAAVAGVLIFGGLGFPALGIAGAGWATVLGTSTSSLLALALLLRPRYVRDFGNGRLWGFDRALFARLLRFGVPQGVGVALETLAFALFLVFVGKLGKYDLAATSIACTLNLLAYLPMLGVAQAVEVLVGQHLGGDRPDLAERSVWTAAVFSLGGTGLVAFTYIAGPEWLAAPFHTQNDPAGWKEVVARVPLLLRFVAVYCLFDSLNLVLSFALRGAGDTRFVMNASLALAWPVMVLPSWAAWYFGWGMYWAWAFASVYIILLSLVFLARFRQGRWRGMRVIEHAPEAQPAAAAPETDGDPLASPAA
jgi:MATE family multidrug resistance protein